MAAVLNPVPHGGDVFAAARELGVEPAAILDFSASINPLGPPEEAMRAAAESLTACRHYPERDGESLRQALAEQHRLPVDCLLPAAGSTELIYLLPQVLRPRRALLLAPAFGEYARALQLAGCRVEELIWQPGSPFDLDRLLAALDAETDLLLLANPGNPSGEALPRQLLLALIDRLPPRISLVIDEAFADFCPSISLLDQVSRRSRLWVLRSLTKFYAIPGLRAGFVAGPAAGIERLRWRLPPWTLSVPAAAAARACLAAADYRRRTLDQLPAWRRQLCDGLEKLGLSVIPGAANYLLVRLPEDLRPAADLVAALRRRRILVRDCASFSGLDDGWLRLAVRCPEENRTLLAALADRVGKEVR
ncbi:L-threonine O-3-phosphate decarboxylase [Geothermobacter ehrlichii]|uniref:threonine-phosphate decarboxylase n=1 Tax=Geothermobacter ehrlichii TaxID=213224 RepID=A0A5D3WMA2_9BACT|nr:threonine-phosphate decarboxylase CobD [Geothermobacter ehrlichii]TYO98448.1 L-threonine O-3-phosphate decarboxylase [Geothermobacter ehrlichii]